MVDTNLEKVCLPFDWYDTGELFHSRSKSSNTSRLSARPHVWRPPTDVYVLEQAVVVKVEIAGMRENEFSISVQDRVLVVHGIRADVPERRAYHQMEIRYGEFYSEVELPAPVRVADAQAEYRAGFLVITLPKQKPKQIQIVDK